MTKHCLVVLLLATAVLAQLPSFPDLTHSQDYGLHRTSSYDRSGGNADFREVPAGGTLTLLDENGPG